MRKKASLSGKTALLSAAALLIALTLASGCVNKAPVYHPDITPGPTSQLPPGVTEPAVTEEPTPTPAPTAHAEQHEGDVDAMGNTINGAEHYRRYITFKDLNVYEEDGDTFLDGIIVNAYSRPLVCAVDIVYLDEGGGELTRAQLQTRDGNYMLVLAPGDNIVFAHILTDTSLLSQEYTLEFDTSTGVHPE